jgi:hypothetical protein
MYSATALSPVQDCEGWAGQNAVGPNLTSHINTGTESHQVLSLASPWPPLFNKVGFGSRKPYSFVELARQLC